MNLGSPDSTQVKDVRKYLRQFLMDKRVIDIPYLLRAFLINAIIVPFRAPKSAHAYSTIWTDEGSPLIALTKHLQTALQQQIPEHVEIAMRYGKPSIKQAYKNIARHHPDVKEVILLPLYPHYAMSSYETAVVQAEEVYNKGKYPFSISTIQPYYNDPLYIDAMCANIKPYLAQDYDQILFSYHSIPERHIHKSDVTGGHCLLSAGCCETPSAAHSQCYRHQCFATTKLITAKLGIPQDKYSISFQSRLGRSEWLKPATDARLLEMPQEGIKKLLVVCPSFVSDCLETLEEIAIRGKEDFMNAGGESYEMIPCMNVHPVWVKAVASLIRNKTEANTPSTTPQYV